MAYFTGMRVGFHLLTLRRDVLQMTAKLAEQREDDDAGGRRKAPIIPLTTQGNLRAWLELRDVLSLYGYEATSRISHLFLLSVVLCAVICSVCLYARRSSE